MASIESRIDSFLSAHNIDISLKDDICALVTGCMEDVFNHVFNQPVPEAVSKKTKKVLKAEKIEDPATCTEFDDLRNCTTGVLNQFCKEHNLKIGGNKKEIMDRVWRHIQGETSDDDKSSRSKSKTEKKVPEKHTCCGTNSAGAPCGVAGTEDFEGYHFCWRHITDAQKFINKPSETTEPVVEKKKKSVEKKNKSVESNSDSDTKPAPKSRAKTVSKKKTPEPELVTEDEVEVDNFDDNE